MAAVGTSARPALDGRFFMACRFSDLPGWTDDVVLEAFAAFRRSAFQVLDRAYRTGALGIDHHSFAEAFDAARRMEAAGEADARRFFETGFRPFRVVGQEDGAGFVTGYYEPEVEASPHRTETFRVPLYRRPDDLVDIDDGSRPSAMDPYFEFARSTASGLEEYPDRAAIEQGALAGRGLEIAWLADRVDAFFIHVQGAARLKMPDGTVRRVTYAAKTGHRFTGPGGLLVERGEISREAISMQTIRAWLKSNPERADELLWRNRSFIFFREATVDDPDLGPVAAAKVPLAPGRSIAVDRKLHTFATPFYIDAPDLRVVDEKPFRRLMIAQDTGSAIVGPARGDLFFGSGDRAGEMAGGVRHAAQFYALLPRRLAEEAA